jgi:hypothetical protein
LPHVLTVLQRTASMSIIHACVAYRENWLWMKLISSVHSGISFTIRFDKFGITLNKNIPVHQPDGP